MSNDSVLGSLEVSFPPFNVSGSSHAGLAEGVDSEISVAHVNQFRSAMLSHGTAETVACYNDFCVTVFGSHF
jgi:hypothetical protein